MLQLEKSLHAGAKTQCKKKERNKHLKNSGKRASLGVEGRRGKRRGGRLGEKDLEICRGLPSSLQLSGGQHMYVKKSPEIGGKTM